MEYEGFWHSIWFCLANTNTSRIFATLADIDKLAFLWLAAPITGFVGSQSLAISATIHWHPKCRRRPFFFIGSVLAFFGDVFDAEFFGLVDGSDCLVVDGRLDQCVDGTFRAFVGDKLDASQQTTGFCHATFFIGCGGDCFRLPTIFTDYLGVSNRDQWWHSRHREVPSTSVAPYFLSVLWTVLSSTEDAPSDMQALRS